jgi:hypothetical protein
MPTWGWILIAVLAVIALVAVVLAVRSSATRRRSEHLQQHFGEEYERVVDRTGDQQAAEAELSERERNRKKLDIVALSPEAHAEFSRRWKSVQTAFVDNPSQAVHEADTLVTRVMRERGYPVDEFEQRAADISVDHPTVVENYRAAHDIYLAQNDGRVGTEIQREAFVHYRALFEKLLDTDKHDAPKEARA